MTGAATMDQTARLDALHADFLATSTTSMPLAGMLYWGAVAVASLFLSPMLTGYVVLFGSGMIFPLAMLIDRLRGQNRIVRRTVPNPLLTMFLRSIVLVALAWPLVIIAARAAGEPDLIVLGGAILMGIIWIPYGWAADDPAGMQHAVLRSLGCYAAYVLVAEPYRAAAVCVVVLLAYLYSLVRMRRPLPGARATAP